MATLTITLVAGATTYTKSTTLSNADATRLQTAYKAAYPPPPKADGSPGDPLTNAQIFDALAKGIFDGMKANVLACELSVAPPTVADLPMT